MPCTVHYTLFTKPLPVSTVIRSHFDYLESNIQFANPVNQLLLHYEELTEVTAAVILRHPERSRRLGYYSTKPDT